MGTKGYTYKPGKFLKAPDGDSRCQSTRVAPPSHAATALVPTPLEGVRTDVVRSCEGGGTDACGPGMCVVGACEAALGCKFPNIAGWGDAHIWLTCLQTRPAATL